MKFYNRENELAQLQKIEGRSKLKAQMTFVVGRRRIGKTSLLVKANENKTMVYFFIAKKSELLLCEEFIQEIQYKLKVEIFGTFRTFRDIFGYLMELSKTMHFTLVMDEFQQFYTINPSIYSDMQNIWDKNKEQSNINLILCGSVYSMMSRIFEQAKEPLFGRATAKIHLKPFTISTLKGIMRDYAPDYKKEDLLAFYMITGGVAKYVDLLIEEKAFTLDNILNAIFNENSLFLDEGRNILIDEFGKDYGIYFSILSLIASSRTSRSEMESLLEVSVGGYLERMEDDFNLIKRLKPIFSKPNSRQVKYQIHDNFLNFWFRFIYKYRSAIEIGNLSYVKKIVERDYTTYSDRFLEKYFKERMTEEEVFSAIGSSWEKNGQNEIDIIGINDLDRTATFVEVKRKKDNISIPILKEKVISLESELKGYDIKYLGLSIDDM